MHNKKIFLKFFDVKVWLLLGWLLLGWLLLAFNLNKTPLGETAKVKVFPLQSDIPITFLCLTVWVGSISRVLVVLQKNNNLVVRHHFWEMPFLLGTIFVRWYRAR